jgi:hypothetical protein
MELHYDDLIERLLRLDEDAALLDNSDARFHLVIVGGGALILWEYVSRATHDIDALDASQKIQSLLAKYDINTRVAAFMNNFPYNYETRLRPLPIKGKKIDFYTASLEDIVIAKLYSPRDTDLFDIETARVRKDIDWELLETLALADDEAKGSALNEQNYQDFLQNYQKYIERFRPCEY